MNVLIPNPVEESVTRCVTNPRYKVVIMVRNEKDKYLIEDAVVKAVSAAYFGKANGNHQFTRFYKRKCGFNCEFIDTGSIIDCVVLKNDDAIRGRRYHMIISTGNFDERISPLLMNYNKRVDIEHT